MGSVKNFRKSLVSWFSVCTLNMELAVTYMSSCPQLAHSFEYFTMNMHACKSAVLLRLDFQIHCALVVIKTGGYTRIKLHGTEIICPPRALSYSHVELYADCFFPGNNTNTIMLKVNAFLFHSSLDRSTHTCKIHFMLNIHCALFAVPLDAGNCYFLILYPTDTIYA